MLDIKGTGCTRMIVKGKENEYDRTVKPSFQGTLFSSPVSLISPTHLLFTSPAAHCETQYILYRQLFLASKKSASAPAEKLEYRPIGSYSVVLYQGRRETCSESRPLDALLVLLLLQTIITNGLLSWRGLVVSIGPSITNYTACSFSLFPLGKRTEK